MANTPDRGARSAEPAAPAPPPGSTGAGRLVAPVKAVRVLGALRRVLEEINRVDLDDAARRRVIEAHRAMLIEVASTVSDGLIDEMVALHIEPLDPEATRDQLEVAQAQLIGWVDGMMFAEAELDGPVTIGFPLEALADPSPEPLPPPEPMPPPEPVPGPEPMPPPEPVPGPEPMPPPEPYP
ncbi:MAG TPA: proteasome activator [Acidimicrobiales bacterium]|nr:proteasome activator [Acidimicrobiales bacterium]